MIKLSKVLVIDDEPHVASYVSMLLRATFGEVEVCKAHTKDEGIALFTSEKPDLVLLDYNLIGTTGLVVLRAIMAIDPEAIVLMLTSVSIRHTAQDALDNGASGYLLKEQPQEDLALELKNAVEAIFGDEPAE